MSRTISFVVILLLLLFMTACNFSTASPAPSIDITSVFAESGSAASVTDSSEISEIISAIKYRELYSDDLKYGTTPGNLMNDGICAVDNKWVFFRNSNTQDALFKIRYDGTDLIKLSIDAADYINVFDGFVYFIYNIFMEESYLAKADIISGEVTFLNSDKAADFLSVHNDSVYYISDTMTEGYLKKYIDPNKSETIISKKIDRYQFDGNELFYLTSDPDNHLYKSNIFGTDEVLITEDPVSFFISINDQVYYTDKINNHLYRISEGGTVEKICVELTFGRFNISKEWIFFVNKSDNGFLYKMKSDGSRISKIADSDCYSINIFENILVYHATGGSGFLDLRQVRSDGSGDSLFLGG